MMALVIHGTSEMPAHMRNGPRNYNHVYNKDVGSFNNFNYISAETPGEEVSEDSQDVTALKNAYPGLLDQVQDQLLRIHHRNPFLSDSV